MAFSPNPTDSPNLEHLLQLGIRTAKSGNVQSARMMFQQVLDQDKRNERAWLWMASIADNEVDRRRYLETVLDINPRNEQARKYIAALEQALQSTEGSSLSLGIKLLVAIIAILVVVFVIAIVIS
jgi:thioredoxin-like negative regulator of GroEL